MARQTAVGEPFPNQERKYGLVHDALAAFSGSTRQIHRGLGASGANPKARVQAREVSGRHH
jgi:hypothetical protein